MNNDLSWSIAADSPTSSAYFTDLFVKPAAIYDFLAILLAKLVAVSISLSWGTTYETSPNFKASYADIGSPVKHISIAFDFPTADVRRTVPPDPGNMPKFISGCPSLAFSEAIKISAIIASSNPPPKAIPFIAAIKGFLNLGIILDQTRSK